MAKKNSFEHYTDKRMMSTQKKLNEGPREKSNFIHAKARIVQTRFAISRSLVDAAQTREKKIREKNKTKYL